MPRRKAGVSVAVAALALIVGGFASCIGSSPSWPAPRIKADPVPAGTTLSQFPANCGLGAATVESLVPRSRAAKTGDFGKCEWFPGRRSETRRFLQVTLSLARATFPPGMVTNGDLRPTPITMAMGQFGAKYSDAKPRPVSGLGEEALVQYKPAYGATVSFRFGNANVVIGYRDFELPLSEGDALGGAFKAAAEVATSLGTPGPVRPALDTSPRPPSIAQPPEMCGAVAKATVRKLVKDAESEHDNPKGFGVEGARSTDCEWRNDQRLLSVQASAMPDTDRADGTRRAMAVYLAQHHEARAEEPISARDEKYFQAVGGLGDQAFAAHVEEGSPGRVLFRVRNVLVEVVLGPSHDAKPPPKDLAVNGAHAVAKEVARALSSVS